MANETVSVDKELMLSDMAENLVPSEIIKLANEVNEKSKNGEHIFNLG